MVKKRFLCIGASAAGIACINTLKRLDPDREILCFSAESENPYNKCLLADWLSGQKNEGQVSLASKEQLRSKGVIFYSNTPITSIDPLQKRVTTVSGDQFGYDDLLIATGARPYIPPIEGLSAFAQGYGRDGSDSDVFTFHTASDTKKIISFVEQNKPKRAVIIGAGLTGLEAADALWQRGVDSIAVIERNSRIMSALIPETASQFLSKHMNSLGIDVLSETQIVSVSRNEKKLALRLSRLSVGDGGSSGDSLKADMLIIATGVQSNIELALHAGIFCEQGGIITNSVMQTSIPGIYAAGDVALVTDQITQKKITSRTWPDAMAQGMTAAHAIAGLPKAYQGVVMSLNSAFFGLKFASSYANSPISIKDDNLQVQESVEPSYSYIRLLQGVVKGYCLIGDTSEVPGLRRSLITGQSI